MKKTILGLAAMFCLVGCSPSGGDSQSVGNTPSTAKLDKALTPEQEVEQHIYELRKAFEKRGSNKDSLRALYDSYMQEMSVKYQGDSLGLLLVETMAEDFNSQQLDSVMNICSLYGNSEKLQRLLQTSKASENTAVGKRYVDFGGMNTKTEKPMTLSSVVSKGKPVLVNFWSSWSAPSRSVIRDDIFELEEEYRGKVNVLSVAIWEDSVTFVNRGVSELMMSWPVMYCEGREHSPAELYGFSGVPYVMLIGKNGIIKGRNLQRKEIKEAIEKELKGK